MVEKSLFLSPHNDDETLFGSFTLQYEMQNHSVPRVVVCFRSFKQEVYGISHYQRESETSAALREMDIVSWTQWPIPDDSSPEVAGKLLLESLRREKAESPPIARVYAPAWEEGGNTQHNILGEIAYDVFRDSSDVIRYMTYTWPDGRSKGNKEIEASPNMIQKKLAAMLCYRSQIWLEETRDHFLCPQFEYYA